MDLKAFITKMLLQSIIYSLEIIEKVEYRKTSHKQTQMKIIKLKNITTEVNDLLNKLNRRVEMTGDINLRTE